MISGGKVAIPRRGQQDVESQIRRTGSPVAPLETCRAVPDPLVRHALDHRPAGFAPADNIATSHGVLSFRA